MIGALIVTHGGLAEEFVRAARTIEPDLATLHSLVLDWNVDPAEAGRQVGERIRDIDEGDGVVVLTDMFGGTPSNVSLPFLEAGKVEIVSGVNLPMVITLASRSSRGIPLGELARLLRTKGRRSIDVASDILRGRASGEEGQSDR